MEDNILNPTAPEGESGGQAEVVAQPQQETETPTEAAEQESVVGSHNPDFDLIEVGEDGEPEETKDKPDTQPEGAARADQTKETRQQTPEENAAIRAARIRAQKEAEAEAAARTDAAIAGLSGLRNPYTGKPFASLKELSEYSANVLKAENEKRAKETGRSIAEIEEDAANRAFLSELRRERQSEALQNRSAPQDDFIRRDLADFLQKHPTVDVAKLDANEKFRLFCGSRYGREPLAQLYDEYQIIVGDAERSAVTRAEQKAQRSTGGGTPGGVTLTPSQKKDLDRWNAEHPEMAMTAKEFLGR